MSTEPTPAERFSTSIGYTGSAHQQTADQPPGDASATAADQFVVSPWGIVGDPHEAIKVFEADPTTREALLDNGHPLHFQALAKRGQLYARAYGAERGDVPRGETYGEVAKDVWQEPEEVTEAQMQAAFINTAATAVERAGFGAETARAVAEIAIGAGLSTMEVGEIAQAVGSSRQYASPEAALASLGDKAAELVRAAQLEANALGLPAEVLDLPIGDGGIMLGEHPDLIRALARRRGVR